MKLPVRVRPLPQQVPPETPPAAAQVRPARQGGQPRRARRGVVAQEEDHAGAPHAGDAPLPAGHPRADGAGGPVHEHGAALAQQRRLAAVEIAGVAELQGGPGGGLRDGGAPQSEEVHITREQRGGANHQYVLHSILKRFGSLP